MRVRKEKDRSSVGADEPVKTKNNVSSESLGYYESNVEDRLQQDAVIYRAGYEYAYSIFMPRILELEKSLRWYIKRNVADMFHDIGFDGAEAALQRSTQRFWKQSRGRDAA